MLELGRIYLIMTELQRYVLIDNIVLEKIEHEPTLVVVENDETGECDIWIDHTLMTVNDSIYQRCVKQAHLL